MFLFLFGFLRTRFDLSCSYVFTALYVSFRSNDFNFFSHLCCGHSSTALMEAYYAYTIRDHWHLTWRCVLFRLFVSDQVTVWNKSVSLWSTQWSRMVRFLILFIIFFRQLPVPWIFDSILLASIFVFTEDGSKQSRNV